MNLIDQEHAYLTIEPGHVPVPIIGALGPTRVEYAQGMAQAFPDAPPCAAVEMGWEVPSLNPLPVGPRAGGTSNGRADYRYDRWKKWNFRKF